MRLSLQQTCPLVPLLPLCLLPSYPPTLDLMYFGPIGPLDCLIQVCCAICELRFPISFAFSQLFFRVEVFFIFHPHATRLFHAPNFMASLSLSPSHPKFPAIPVLHAICAMASSYTAAVSSPPFPDFAKVQPGERVFCLCRI